MHNPNVRATHNYSIVDDLAQAPTTMFALKVLQSCMMKSKELWSNIGGVDPLDSNIMTFSPTLWKPRLPHHLAF